MGEQDLQELFEAVREACSRSGWSKGVELARAGAVVGEQDAGDHVVLKVSTAGELISRTVTLHPADAEWTCDCDTGEDACVHVAAAAIALRRARQAGQALPQATGNVASIRYLFTRAQGALLFARAFVRSGEEEVFEASLAAINAGRIKGPAFVATSADLAVDLALGMRTNGFIPREALALLLAPLSDCADIRLDGRPVTVSKQKVGMRVLVEDQGAGFRLSLGPDPSISETFSNGVALCGDTLRALAEPRLLGRELAELQGGKYYGPESTAELVSKILPSLRERIEVEVRARRLPRTAERALPRVKIDVAKEADALVVLATLVYGDPPIARVDGGRLTLLSNQMPVRDELAEERLARQLSTQLGLAPGHKERFEAEAGVAFAKKLAGWRGQVEGEAHREFFLAPPLVPHLRTRGDSFDLWFDSPNESGKPGRADPSAVVRAWRSGSSLAPLLEGGWAPLPRDWMAKFGDRVADLLAARSAMGEVPACALPDLARLCGDLDQPPPPGFTALKPLLDNFEGLPEAALPSDLPVELRHYQRQGVRWLGFLRKARLGALLADDMGLGKTLQALCAIEQPALVVAPTSVVFNWAAEAARFRPSLKVCVYHGPGRQLDPKADLTLTSYALLRLDAEKLAAARWKTVVLDEAQSIKNPDSQVARAAYRLQGEFRLALTGTPVENRLEELWSELHFLNPGLLGGRSDFDERYAQPIAQGTDGAASRLRERIRPFVLRRLKREVAPELPPRSEVVLHCVLSEEERAVYEAVRAATRTDVLARLSQGGAGVLAALEALLRLRQACCHPSLVPGQSAESSAKMEVLLESLEEAAADGHKSLVFSQWTSLLDLIEPHLSRSGIDFCRLDGATRDRGEVVSRFQGQGGPPVMLISLKAGGAGLNLTAADHVFLVDPWWNPAVEDQAADRAHRIGQDKPVFVHRLVAKDTVEERILALQGAKRALAEAALSGASQAAGLTREDLMELLA